MIGEPKAACAPAFCRSWANSSDTLGAACCTKLANDSGMVSAVARLSATLTTIAAVMLFVLAGCGGGSSNQRAGTVLQRGPIAVVSKDREFRTVIPRGYANHPSVAQYWAEGPAEGGFATTLLVVRERVSKEVTLNTFVHRALRGLRQAARGVARLEPLSVDGEQALAVDYLVTATGTLKGQETHVRQAFVKHGPWVMFIRDVALPAQYQASLGALEEVLGNWHWQ